MYLSVPIPVRNEKTLAVVMLPGIRTRDIVGSDRAGARDDVAAEGKIMRLHFYQGWLGYPALSQKSAAFVLHTIHESIPNALSSCWRTIMAPENDVFRLLAYDPRKRCLLADCFRLTPKLLIGLLYDSRNR